MKFRSFESYHFILSLFVAAWFVAAGALAAAAQEPTSSAQATGSSETTSSAARYQQLVDRSVEYLRQRGQADDGSFSSAVGIGPTGVVVSGLLSTGVAPHDPLVVKSLNYLVSNVQPDGGIYRVDSSHKNYDTCIAMVALAQANQDGKYQTIIDRAERFVKGLQWDEGEGKDPSDLFYGGAGYGSHSRPDLSNTAYLIDALHTLGNPENDEAIQKALSFVSRCQNLESPANNSEFAAKINDGGFYYTVADGGESKAGNEPNGGLRSYGSMTYAGLKSMIYAGVGADDPRVEAAVTFLRKHYSLDDNPGVGQQGLFYYYQTMAKALDAFGEAKFADASGTEHDWKVELLDKLSELQQPDGSWVNPNTRWMEGDPNLVSGYALLALSHCKP
ncbi:MAG: prenyltransferase/squalene oxidase repeat-containing protein [Pirellulaceae bacterium]